MTIAGNRFFRVDPLGPQGSGLPATRHDPSDTPVHGAGNPHGYTAFADPKGRFTVGVWACDAGLLHIENLAIDEACFLIEGEVIVTDSDGHVEIFRAGDSFVLGRGFTGTWYMPRPIRKFNAMYRHD